MPTKKRITVPGALHHIMARGIDGQAIFADRADRELFLHLLGQGIARTGYRCYAWALMDNHYHLLVRAGVQRLEQMMKRLNGTYARLFNRKRSRHGYVFQSRYRSIATQDQGYIEELVRYIHLNPLRAGTVRGLDRLDTYPWCGHAVLMGRRTCAFQDTGPVLRRFGRTTSEARKAYRAFLAEGIKDSAGSDTVAAVRRNNAGVHRRSESACWVIGDPEFVRKALHDYEAQRAGIARYNREGWTLDELRQRIAERLGVAPEDLAARGRVNARSEGRKALAYLGHRVLGFTVAEIARYLGVSGPAVSRMLDAGNAIAENRGISKIIKLPPG